MANSPEGMAESLKQKTPADSETTPGVRGPQSGVNDSGVKGPADAPTNWSRSGNPLHKDKVSSPTIEADTVGRSAPDDLKRVQDGGRKK